MKKTFCVLSVILIMGIAACSNDDDYTLNDIVGKWECYRMEYTIKDSKTGEILSFRGTPQNSLGKDSTFTIAFYENGTTRSLTKYGEINPYEIHGKTLRWWGQEFNIDELTNERLIISSRKNYFSYNYEKTVEDIQLYGFRRIE